MDRVTQYRQTIERILTDYSRIPYSHGELHSTTVFDREADRYLLMVFGRDRGRRVHGCTVHLDIIDGKIWVRRDGLGEGIVMELLEAGIPREAIVLAFRAYEEIPEEGLEAASDPQGTPAAAPHSGNGGRVAVP